MGRHLWAIGVDTDWYEDLSQQVGIISPGAWRSHVLTSVRKRYDLAVYEALQTVASGDRLHRSGPTTYGPALSTSRTREASSTTFDRSSRTSAGGSWADSCECRASHPIA